MGLQHRSVAATKEFTVKLTGLIEDNDNNKDNKNNMILALSQEIFFKQAFKSNRDSGIEGLNLI